MKHIYDIAGFSRQAHHQYLNRRLEDVEVEQLVINTIIETRSMHPVMGLKKIYYLHQPDYIGRDRFIYIGIINGLCLERLKSYRRTTFSNRNYIFFNLAKEVLIIDINQVWVSDITYYRIGDKFYYLTFIMDVFSRRILGYAAYPTLEARANCIAMERALLQRKGSKLDKLIHHSDRGSQYISKEYLTLLKHYEIKASMCDSVYENSHIERVNGIIKNEYLKNWSISSFDSLVKHLEEAVYVYNNERPHWAIKLMSPVKYEEYIKNIDINERDEMQLFDSKAKNGNESFIQQKLFN